MNNLRHLCTAVVLTLALTMSVSAGQMPCPITDPPSPSADGQMHTGATDGHIPTTATGQVQTGVEGQMDTTVAGQIHTLNNVASPVDPITQMALNLWQSVLSLF